jgi:hypothetical protein
MAHGISPQEATGPEHYQQEEDHKPPIPNPWPYPRSSGFSEISWVPYTQDHDIDQVAKKANNTLAFLRRNIQQCPRNTKALCYTTLVRPVTEYASIIWDP